MGWIDDEQLVLQARALVRVPDMVTTCWSCWAADSARLLSVIEPPGSRLDEQPTGPTIVEQ